MVNGIVSLMLFFTFSLLLYRNPRYFCVLILSSANLIYLLIRASNYLVVFRVFYVEDHFNCKQWELYFFFSNLDSFISFSSLIDIARTSRTMFNNSGESGHPCLVPDLRGNVIRFSPLRIMFAVGLSYMAFTMLGFLWKEWC